jgi:hypothetical protein
MGQLTFLEKTDKKMINLKEASEWASQYLNRNVTISNISYLLQYGRISKYGNNGNPLLNAEELKDYYDSLNKEKRLKKILGDDLNWHLSFIEYTEAERKGNGGQAWALGMDIFTSQMRFKEHSN